MFGDADVLRSILYTLQPDSQMLVRKLRDENLDRLELRKLAMELRDKIQICVDIAP